MATIIGGDLTRERVWFHERRKSEKYSRCPRSRNVISFVCKQSGCSVGVTYIPTCPLWWYCYYQRQLLRRIVYLLGSLTSGRAIAPAAPRCSSRIGMSAGLFLSGTWRKRVKACAAGTKINDVLRGLDARYGRSHSRAIAKHTHENEKICNKYDLT